MTNQELLETYEKAVSSQPYNLSKNTIKTYLNNIEYLIEFLNKNICEITSQDIKKYLSSSRVSDATYNLRINAFKSLYEVLRYHHETENIICNNPTDGLKKIKEEKARKIPLTKEEQYIIIRNCKNIRDKAIFTTLISTGLRIHELINLTLKQYLNRGEYGEIHLEVNKGSYRDEYAYINEETAKVIDEYLKTRKEGCEYLFVSNGGKQMDRTCISRTLKNTARRSGEIEEYRISQFSNHLLRHTTATNMVNEDVPMDVIAKYLRHHSMGTVMTYVDTSIERISKYN